MRQPEIIRSGGLEIVYLDFSGLKNKEEIFTQIEAFGSYLRKHPLHSLYTLTNLEGMFFNTEVFNKLSLYAKANNPYVKESALIGLKGMIQIFYKGFVKITGRNMIICNSKSEAVLALSKHVTETV